MSNDKNDALGDADVLPPTALAQLAKTAKERMGDKPDVQSPAAIRTMAAIVRDLKGMPEIVVTRENPMRLKLMRRGKLGAVFIEYHPKVRYVQVDYEDFPGMNPTSTKMHRYMFDADRGKTGEWSRTDDGGELIDDVRVALLRLYPELGAP
jgi:hypothetical protein